MNDNQNKQLSYQELMALYIKECNRSKEFKKQYKNECKRAAKFKEKYKVESQKTVNLEKQYKEESKRAANLEKKYAELEKEFKEQQQIIQQILNKLEDKNIKLKNQLIHTFGIKSDKQSVVKANEAEEYATTKIGENKSKKKAGRKTGTKDASKFDKSLIETKEIIVDIETKTCEACGKELSHTSDNIEYKVDIIPAKVILTKYIIKHYECKNCNEIVAEPSINCFNNESFLTPSLAACVVNYKYNYALPLYRIESMLKHQGAPISRNQLANYCINTAEMLEPIYNKLKEYLLKTSIKVLQADETTIQVLENNKDRRKSYMWLYATSMYEQPIYIYEYQDSREAKHPTLFLQDFKGYLVCDDYAGYNNIPNVKTCRCWFHAKKKYADFLKTLKPSAKKESQADTIHDKISKIFYKDNLIQEQKLTPSEIKEKREIELKPLVDEYFEYIENLVNQGLDKSSVLGKAVLYSINIKEDLYRFFEDGHIPLTNNLSERAIKPFVILRKNCLFCDTKNGAEASAILMSIVQTAKMNLLKPDEYIRYVLERIDDTKTSDIDSLLPFSSSIPNELKYSKKDLD